MTIYDGHTEYENQLQDLEHDLEILTEAAETAEANRSTVYGWEIPELYDEDELDLDEARGYVQTVAEAAGEIASILAAARDKVQERIENLHVEEPCDECGAVIVNDDQSLHEDWCEQREE